MRAKRARKEALRRITVAPYSRPGSPASVKGPRRHAGRPAGSPFQLDSATPLRMSFRNFALLLLRAVKSDGPALERSTARRLQDEAPPGARITRPSSTLRDDSSDQEGAGQADDRGTRILGRPPCHHPGWAEIRDYEGLAGERGSGSGRNNGHLPRRLLRLSVHVDRTHLAASGRDQAQGPFIRLF